MQALNSLFGLHEQALFLSGRRAAILSNNIANADTPGYLSRDLDFKSILQAKALRNTGNSNLDGSSLIDSLKYRMPNQVSADGNSVDVNLEKAEFANNTMRWLASYTFINQNIKEIRSALRGE